MLGKPVETVQPRLAPMVERVVLTGRVVTPGSSKLGVSLLGTVAAVTVEEGARVSAGQPLLRLADGEQLAAVLQARAGLASAEAELSKVRKISGRVESANVEEAEVTLEQAERELDRMAQLTKSGAADRKALETAQDTVATATTRLKTAKIRAEGAKGPESRSVSARVEEAKAALALAEAAARALSRDEMKARAQSPLAEVGLSDLAHRKAAALSGGQQQRAAVARALIMDPPLLLADEPTGNLDTATAERVFELFRKMLLNRGKAALLVTHDPRLAERADRILTLVDGKIVDDRRRQI